MQYGNLWLKGWNPRRYFLHTLYVFFFPSNFVSWQAVFNGKPKQSILLDVKRIDLCNKMLNAWKKKCIFNKMIKMVKISDILSLSYQ